MGILLRVLMALGLWKSRDNPTEPSPEKLVQGATETQPPTNKPRLTEEQTAAGAKIQSLVNEFARVYATEIKGQSRHQIYEVVLDCKRRLAEIETLLERHSYVEWDEGKEFSESVARLELLHQPLFEKRRHDSVLVAIVDTETTGLSDSDEPVSVAVVLLEVSGDRGDVVEELGCYYGMREPNVPVHPKARAIHGLSDEALKGQSLDMKALCKLVDSADLLVAHNAKFDRRMLGKVLPRVISAEWACSIYTLKFDWGKIATGQSLDAICEALKVTRPHPHNSINDCRALIAVLKTRGGSETRSSTRLARLIRNAWAPPP